MLIGMCSLHSVCARDFPPCLPSLTYRAASRAAPVAMIMGTRVAADVEP